MAYEELRDDDPDYLIVRDYKAAHNIVRDCNTADVVVLMRRARSAERQKILRIIADGPSGTAAARIQSLDAKKEPQT